MKISYDKPSKKTQTYILFIKIYSAKGVAELTGGIRLAAAEGAEGPATTHSKKNDG